jgi:predicted Ser/Thr protein kinase
MMERKYRKTHKFGDMLFHRYGGHHATKMEAMASAKNAKMNGMMARIVKHEAGYCVYTHK